MASLADGAAGRLHPSPNEQPAQLFSPGAAEPECRAATLQHSHHRLSVALHARQTLATNRVPLTDRQTGSVGQTDGHQETDMTVLLEDPSAVVVVDSWRFFHQQQLSLETQNDVFVSCWTGI